MNNSWIGLFLCIVVWSACSTTKKVNTGTIAFEQKQFAKAIGMLEVEMSLIDKEDPQYAAHAYMLGESYKNTGNTDAALKWYIESAKLGYGPLAYWEMAYMLRKKKRYEDAILSYQRLLRITQGRENDIKKEIEKCKQARRMLTIDAEREYTLEPIEVNSAQSDYAPAIYRDQYMVFTSDRDKSGSSTYHWTGRTFSDIYIHEMNTAGVASFEELNTDANEGSVVFSQDGGLLFFTRCHSTSGDSYCRILMSKYNGRRWEEPVEAFEMKEGVNYRDPALIENDSVLLLTSEDPTGIGGHDLYYSLLEDDGSWSAPELMPPYLNSVGQERFPTWVDGVLYYSSDHFAGLGGLDIFKTKLQPDGSWSKPENVMAPINSSEDDMSLIAPAASTLSDDIHRQLYFVSSRSVMGGDDIYRYTEYKTQEEMNTPQDTTTEIVDVQENGVKKNFFLQIKVVEPLYAMPDNPNSYVVGKRAVEGAAVRFKTANRDDTFITREDGTLLFPIDTGAVYMAIAGKKEYLNSRAEYQITEDYNKLEDGQVFELTLELNRIFENVDIVMDDIYYDFNQATIREDAKPALDQLITLMNNNPTISIQLSAHTDCRGEEDYNQELSQARAQSAVDYMRTKGGIDTERLTAIGYGESQPEIECDCDTCMEDDHQINRRTTFRIVSQ